MRFDARLLRGTAAALAAAGLLAASGLHAQEPAGGPDDTITLNFANADIHAVVKAVAEMTGRNFLIDPRVQGTVNIIAPKPVPRNLVFPILLSALRVQGFAAVGGELGYINIVPEADAKFYASAAARARSDQIVTEVFRLQFESAQQLVATLRPLISPNNVINAFPASNTIVITDYGSNIARVRKVISNVDQPQPAQVMSIKLRYAAAIDVGQAVQRLMPELAQPTGPGAAPRVALSVDGRTNSLLVRADHPAVAKRIQELADNLDLPGAAGGNIYVVYLKNAQADRLAEALRAIVTGQPAARAPAAAPTAGPPGAPPPPAAQPVSAPVAAGGVGASAIGALANASIQAHPETNSLVIIAPDAVYRSLRGVIEQLDVRRAQVYVEALIVEVATTKAAEFGIQWQVLNNPSPTGTSGFGIQNFSSTAGSNIGQAARDPSTLGQGLSLGLIRGTITLAGVEILNIAALVRALEQDNTANILSTPTLLTLDNEEAKIQVGQNIPIVTGSFSTLSGAGGAVVNPFQTFERRDIGVTLRVRPQIAEGGTIKLAIYQEVSSIFNAVNPTGIILNKRSLESQVLVDDGQIIVLGGLISDDVQTGTQSVPGLGEIPVLGYLFRYDTRKREKVNLMIFLRPVVLRDAPADASLTGNRYDIIRGIQGAVQTPDRPPLPSMPAPKLPAELPPLMPGQPALPLRAPQAPSVQAPSAQTPSVQTPSVQTPSVQTPSVQTPFDQHPPQ
jgi:general secretion pathway protein D